MATVEFIGSFAWVIQTAIMIMIIVEFIRLFTSFKSSNKDKDDESFMQNVKDLFRKSEQKKKKEEKARKKQLETKEAERKIEEMGRYIAGLSIDARKNIEILEQGHIKLVEVKDDPRFFSITKDVSDKVVETMLNSAKQISDDFKKIRKIELQPLKQEMDNLKQSIIVEEKKVEEIKKNLLNDINEIQSHQEIPDAERDKLVIEINKQINEIDNIIVAIKKIGGNIITEDANLENALKEDLKFDSKISQTALRVQNDLKTVKKSLNDLAKKKLDPKNKGLAHGTYINKLKPLGDDIQVLKKGLEDLTLRHDTEYNNFATNVNKYINELKQIVNNLRNEESKLYGK